jgi:hypothetical protein
MGLMSMAVGIGKKVIGAGHAAADTAGAKPADDSNASGTPLFDKVRKWAQGRNANKNMGANDLSGVAAQTDSGSASAKKGGTVKREGLLHVHEGERILTKAQTKKYEESKTTKKAPKKTAKKAGPRKRA